MRIKSSIRSLTAVAVMLIMLSMLIPQSLAVSYDDNAIMRTDKAGDLICVLSGREYTKAYDGEAIAGYYYCSTGYSGPIIVGTTPESVAFKTTWDSRVLETAGNVTYEGKIYYYSSTEYFMPGNLENKGENKLYKCNNGESISVEDAATELLKTYSLICGGKFSSHQSVTETVLREATCDEAGKIIRTCNDCGKVAEELEIAKKVHTFGEVTVEREPDCTTAGTQSAVCIECGHVKSEQIPAVGHSFGQWSTEREPRCEVAGSEVRECGSCGHVESQSIPPLNHKYGEFTVVSGNVVIPPIVKNQTCSDCGHVNTVNDWGYVWVTALALVGLVGICVGVVAYIKAYKNL